MEPTKLNTADTISDVVSAYKILFGNRVDDSVFRLPDRKSLKLAYRKKAKLFHPDLAAQSSMSEERLRSIFLKISNAYDTLEKYLGHAKAESEHHFEKLARKSRWEPVKPNVPVPTNQCFTRDYFYTGSLPDRKLRFGEYLFYSGVINWQTFMDALVHQCNTRPLIGALCVEAGFIDQNDVVNIMNNRNLLACEKFGEAAVRMGYVTKKEVSYVLKKQFKVGHPFGRYFVDKSLMSRKELQRHLTDFHHRNMRRSFASVQSA